MRTWAIDVGDRRAGSVDARRRHLHAHLHGVQRLRHRPHPDGQRGRHDAAGVTLNGDSHDRGARRTCRAGRHGIGYVRRDDPCRCQSGHRGYAHVGSYAVTYTATDGYNTTSVTRTVVSWIRRRRHLRRQRDAERAVAAQRQDGAGDGHRVGDRLGGATTCGITQVASSESAPCRVAAGRRRTGYHGQLTLKLRAERAGSSTAASTPSGSPAPTDPETSPAGQATVVVPHDQHK